MADRGVVDPGVGWWCVAVAVRLLRDKSEEDGGFQLLAQTGKLCLRGRLWLGTSFRGAFGCLEDVLAVIGTCKLLTLPCTDKAG